MANKKSLLGGVFACLITLTPLFPARAAADFFSADQLKSIQRRFPVQEIVLNGDSSYQKGAITLGHDHRHQQDFLTLQYAKAIQIQGKNWASLLELKHSSLSQAVAHHHSCPKSQQRSQLEHPQFGTYVICYKPNGKSDFVTATAYPTSSNRQPKMKVVFSGKAADLLTVLKSLRVYS